MNMMTHTPSPQARRCPPTVGELSQAVRRAMALTGMTPTRFGVEATGDRNIVADMISGRREPRAKTRLRLLAHAERVAQEARQHALAVLIEDAGVGGAVDTLIEILDRRDGDPDLEDGGDSEPDVERGDPSWAEWHTRGRHKLDSTGAEQCRTLGTPNMAHEDDEDDDPIEANGDEQDSNCAEDEAGRHIVYAFGHSGAGCMISDPDTASTAEAHEKQGATPPAYADDHDEPDDMASRKPHRDRIRRTRCEKFTRYGRAVYALPRAANDQVRP